MATRLDVTKSTHSSGHARSQDNLLRKRLESRYFIRFLCHGKERLLMLFKQSIPALLEDIHGRRPDLRDHVESECGALSSSVVPMILRNPLHQKRQAGDEMIN